MSVHLRKCLPFVDALAVGGGASTGAQTASPVSSHVLFGTPMCALVGGNGIDRGGGNGVGGGRYRARCCRRRRIAPVRSAAVPPPPRAHAWCQPLGRPWGGPGRRSPTAPSRRRPPPAGAPRPRRGASGRLMAARRGPPLPRLRPRERGRGASGCGVCARWRDRLRQRPRRQWRRSDAAGRASGPASAPPRDERHFWPGALTGGGRSAVTYRAAAMAAADGGGCAR